MVVVKFKSVSEGKHLVKKLMKMQETIDELVECIEEKIEREDEYDYEDETETKYRGGGGGSSYRGRYSYRRSM